MADTIHLTVEDYLKAEKPLPAGSIIVDTSLAIGALSIEELNALQGNGIASIDALEDELVLTCAQILALQGVGVDASDRIVLRDSKENIEAIALNDVAPIAAKGVKVIDSLSDKLAISYSLASALLTTQISFHESDLVAVNNNTKLEGELTPQQVEGLSVKGVDLIDFVSFDTDFVNTITMETTEALLKSNIRYQDDDLVCVFDTGAKLSGLSAGELGNLKSKGIDSIDADDDQLGLTLSQFKALNLVELDAEDLVTLQLSASEMAGLSASQVAELAKKGIDLLDAADNRLALSVAQYTAFGATKLTASDTVTLSDTGSNLAKLSGAQLSALAATGIDAVDAIDNQLFLSSDQYKALSVVGLSASDIVTVTAGGDIALTHGGHHLVLTGSAISGTGNGLANSIKGNATSNTLWGLDGSDTIHGGSGNDLLYGGAGKDMFVFDTRLNKRTNVDKVFDFKSKDDSFHLDNAIFTKLGRGSTAGVKFKADMFVEGTRAKDREDRIVYDKKTGKLFYDQDGTGSKTQVQIATLTNKTTLKFDDFFVI